MSDTAPPRPCAACGEGVVAPRNARGYVLGYRDERDVPIEEDLVLLACDACGEMVLDAATAARLEDALESSYRGLRVRRAREAVEGICAALGITQRELERVIGVSDGYVSKLLHGRRVPDATTLRLLHLVRADPHAALRRIAEIAEIGDLSAAASAEPPPNGRSNRD